MRYRIRIRAGSTRIAKVINPELLQRKDLSPAFTADTAASILGWTIQLDNIDQPDFARSQDELKAWYQEKEVEVHQAAEQLQSAEQTASTRFQAFNTANQALEVLKPQLKHKNEAYHEALEQVRLARIEINDAVSERHQGWRETAKNHEKELVQFKQNLEDKKDRIKELYHEERNELSGQFATDQSDIDNKIELINQSINEEDQTHKHNKKIIADDFKRAKSDKGVDEETIEKAEQDAKQASLKVETVRGYAGMVTQYNAWVSTEYVKREQYVEKLNKHKSAWDTAKNAVEHAESDNKAAIKRLNSELEKVRRTLKETNENLNLIETVWRSVRGYASLAEDVELGIPLNLLVAEIEKAFQSEQCLRAKILDKVGKFSSHMDQLSESQVGNAWVQARQHHLEASSFTEVYEQGFMLTLPDMIESFIDTELKMARDGLIESIRSLGIGMVNFYEELKSMHNGIIRQSASITKIIKKNMLIDALSDIELVMDSKVNDQEYWKDLKEFSALWDEWTNAETRTLPGPDFVKSMETLTVALNNLKSEQKLQDYFTLHIHMVENGHNKIIHNDNELENSTSNGLKYLALCVIYIGITRLLCPDERVKLHWPIDELGILHGENISRLFNMLDRGGIIMMGGFPSEDPNMLRHFKYRQVIDLKKGIRMIDIPSSSLKDKIAKKQAEEATHAA